MKSRHPIRALLVLCLAAAIVLIVSLSAAQASGADYAFTTIVYPGATDTQAHGINNAGQVVGYWHDDASGHSRGFLRNTDGSFVPLDYPGATHTFAYGINDAGQVVGSWYDASGHWHGFLRNTDGSFVPFDLPGAIDTSACGMNDAGLVVGYWYDASNPYHGFLGNADGSIVVDYPSAVGSFAFGINDAGQVVGFWYDAPAPFGRSRGFLRNADGTLVPIDYPGATYTEAYGINNAGQIVGYCLAPSGVGFMATPVTLTDDIDDVIEIVDDAVDAGTLAGTGPGSSAAGKLGAFENMLASAEASITVGDYAGALDQLEAAYAKCDGYAPPPDLVTGTAREAIAAKILALIAKLEALML